MIIDHNKELDLPLGLKTRHEMRAFILDGHTRAGTTIQRMTKYQIFKELRLRGWDKSRDKDTIQAILDDMLITREIKFRDTFYLPGNFLRIIVSRQASLYTKKSILDHPELLTKRSKGELTVERIERTLSKPDKLALIRQTFADVKDTISFDDLFKKVKDKGIDEYELEQSLQKMKQIGEAFEPKNDRWKGL